MIEDINARANVTNSVRPVQLRLSGRASTTISSVSVQRRSNAAQTFACGNVTRNDPNYSAVVIKLTLCARNHRNTGDAVFVKCVKQTKLRRA